MTNCVKIVWICRCGYFIIQLIYS